MRKLVHIQNGDTDVECRTYETGDREWPYEVETPRGDWKARDLFGAMAIAHNYETLPRSKPVVLK